MLRTIVYPSTICKQCMIGIVEYFRKAGTTVFVAGRIELVQMFRHYHPTKRDIVKRAKKFVAMHMHHHKNLYGEANWHQYINNYNIVF